MKDAGLDEVEAQLRSLMLASLAGDATSYRRLLDALGSLLRGYFLRRLGRDRAADAEDLLQETLMAVHARRASYDPDRPFTAWLHAVARYKLVDHYRARRLTVPIDEVDSLFAPETADASTARLDVDRLLGDIPASARDLIRAVKLDGQSVAETAARRGMSESAVKVAIHRALRVLSRRVEGGNP